MEILYGRREEHSMVANLIQLACNVLQYGIARILVEGAAADPESRPEHVCQLIFALSIQGPDLLRHSLVEEIT